jgi:hypothetical protein
MNRRKQYQAWAGVLALIIPLAWLLRGRIELPASAPHAAAPAESVTAAPVTKPTQPGTADTAAKPPLAVQGEEAALLASHNAKVSGWDTEMRFYGRMLDQDGRPVEGVKIAATIGTMRLVEKDGKLYTGGKMEAVSAADGSFTLEGGQGFSLQLMRMEKEGYVLPPVDQFALRRSLREGRYYRLDAAGTQQRVFHPDPAKPEVFRMWKLKEPGEVLHETATRRLKADGSPRDYVFPRNTPVKPPADFRVELVKDTESAFTRWCLVVTAGKGGGVQPAVLGDEFLFTAPETGYRPECAFEISEDQLASAGHTGFPVRFFVRGENGQLHGGVEFRVHDNLDEKTELVSDLGMWGRLGGSRNLEFDPTPLRDKQ